MENSTEIPDQTSSGVTITKRGGLDVNILNPEPQLMVIHNCMDSETASMLTKLVDEKGDRAKYEGNPHCVEYRMNMDGIGTDHESIAVRRLQKVFFPIQNLISQVFKNNAMDFLTGHAGFWILRYDEGGEFTPHVDWSTNTEEGEKKYSTRAMATFAIHLNDDYEGGELRIAGKVIDVPKYSGEVHDGWTIHEVSPIAHGSKYVVLAHFIGVLKD
jgi:hypothetical protein